MRIHGIQCDYSACAHYRLKLPLDQLATLGHETSYSGKIVLSVTHELLHDVDVVVGQRICLPDVSAWWQDMARRNRYMLVYETDDDMFHVDPTNHGARELFTPQHQANAQANLAVADLVTVSTDTLAEVVSEHTSAPIVVLPNRIPQWLTEWEPPQRKDVVTLGWAGSPTHVADWQELASPLRRFLARESGVELHTLGTDYAAKWGPRVRHTGWSTSVDGFLRSIDFHVGLAPLRPSLFNRSKSALRLLELGALGIPYVASDTGPYASYAEGGVAGYLVSRAHEWAPALRMLVADKSIRAELGKRGRELARASTIEGNAHLWEQAYQSVLGRVPA